jgi:hypothetical protein
MSNVKQLKDASGAAFSPKTSIDALTSTGGRGKFLVTSELGVEESTLSVTDVPQISGTTEAGHFASFDSNGGIKDSGCNEGSFIKGVKQNGTLITPEGGVVNVTVQDGLSAFEIAQQQGYTGTVDQWLASLKANIGAFKFVSYDQSAESAFTTGGIGTTYSNTIDSLVAGTDTTPDVILLMNNTDGTTQPTKTFMIATQEAATAGTYEFIYAGDLQSAMSNNVLTEDDVVDNLNSTSTTKPLSANQGNVIAKKLYGELILTDLLPTATIINNSSIDRNTGAPVNNNYNYKIYTIPYDGSFDKISGSTYAYNDGVLVAFYNSNELTAESFMADYVVKGTNTSGYLQYYSYSDVQVPEGCVLIATVQNVSKTIECTANKRIGGISGDIDDLNASITELETAVDGVEGDIDDIESDIDDINSLLNVNNTSIPCDSNLVKYGLLKADGTTVYISNNNRGVSDFIEVQGGSDMIVISGAIQGPNTSYCPICFYSEANVGSYVGYFQPTSEGSVVSGELLNITVPIPPTANYARFALQEATVPVVVKFANPIESCMEQLAEINEDIADINEQLANIDTNVVDYPQIRNNNLPTKAANEELNILMIGSSWGVDSIAALADICDNVGVPVNTGNMYKSGGTIAQYLDDVANNRTNTFFYNHGGTNESLGGKTVLQALQYKNWDIIIVMNGGVDSGGIGTTTEIEGVNTVFAKWLRYLKKNCSNPKVCFVINSTWTVKNEYSKLTNTFKIVRNLMKQSGINIINPAGSAITYARTHTSLDTNNDIYRDSLHLNRGIGRFITAATMYYQLVYPIYGVGLDNCTITGHWDEAASSPTYPDIDVSASNIGTCIECAKEGVCNQFQINIY